MLGSDCSPCCRNDCGDSKPVTDPINEGTWVPSGSWRDGGVTWTFVENPGDESGETWFFFGFSDTSKKGGGASVAEQRDWGNLCNWYSNKTTSPAGAMDTATFNKRATRLPPENAVVHIFTDVSTASVGPVTVKNAYFWQQARFVDSSELTATSAAFDSAGGTVFNAFSDNALSSIVNGGATFNFSAANSISATVNGGATFNESSQNASSATVNGGATFNDFSRNTAGSTVNDGATFNGASQNFLNSTVNGGATFNDVAANASVVNGGATFNDAAVNNGVVNGGATFNGTSYNFTFATVNGGATFNDFACSQRTVFIGGGQFRFSAHPTDLPNCNGSAPSYANRGSATCGCN